MPQPDGVPPDPRAPEPTTVFTGRLWCPVQGELSAIAVTDGRITAVGARALDLLAVPDPGEQIEITDGILIPAFGDGHAHPIFGGLESEGPQVRTQTSVEGIVAEVARYAAEHPQEQWIRGASYDASLAAHGLFDARWLDAAVPDRPVVLRAWDYHTIWVNSRALDLAGITAETADPVLGEIPRRADGSVLGTLREWGAVELVTDLAGPPPLEVRVRSLERASRAYAALGVTWVQDAWVEPAEVDTYLEAARTGRLLIAYNLALYADPRRGLDQLEALITQRERVRALNHPLLTADTVKFFADGVIESETAALLEPYVGSHAHLGMLVWSPEQLRSMVTAVDAAGFQPHIHAIGDRAVRTALDAIEAAAQTNGPRDRRPVIAHVQLIDDADRQRLARLGVIANIEPLWCQLDSLMSLLTTPHLGQERSDTQYPLATLSRLGASLSFGSDWPVSSADPLEGISVACSRQTDDRLPEGGWTPTERLTREAAFAAYTAGVADQGFRSAGTLQVGSQADLVRLSADPFEIAEPRDLDSLRVASTWLAGRLVHPHRKDSSDE